MIDSLRLNTKLISYEGIIGRRDFLLNVLIIAMIGCLFTLPLTISMNAAAETFGDLCNPAKLFWNFGWFLKIWILAGTAFSGYIYISNVIRRLNDINGKINKKLNIITGIMLSIGMFSYALPLVLFWIFYISTILFFLYFSSKVGKITGNYPQDFRKEFNWGAFLGTWIWGLINKSYKTLWILILGWTPIGWLYSLYLGFKGNEWAYNNRRWKSDEEFKKSQRNQTIGFVIYTLIVVPVLVFIIIFAIIFGMLFLYADDPASQEKLDAAIGKIGTITESILMSCYEDYEITQDENKFYVLPSDWMTYDYKTKSDLLKGAANIASANINNGNAPQRKRTYTSQSDELPRTKIYNSLNHNELLGEYIEPEGTSFKELMTAYKFYRPTRMK